MRQGDKTSDPKLENLVSQCQKIVLLAPGLTWLIHGLTPIKGKTVLLASASYNSKQAQKSIVEMGPIHPDMTKVQSMVTKEGLLPTSTPLPKRQEWVQNQPADLGAYDPTKIMRAPDGLCHYKLQTVI